MQAYQQKRKNSLLAEKKVLQDGLQLFSKFFEKKLSLITFLLYFFLIL